MHIESHLDTLVTEEVPFAQFMANKTNLSLMFVAQTARFLRNCGIAEKMAVLQHRTTQV
jgi:hypothetical protein